MVEDANIEYQRSREKWVQLRTKYEAIVLEIGKEYDMLSDEYKAKVPTVSHPITLRDFMPILYGEPPLDERKTYAEQLYVMNKFIDAMNAVADELNAQYVILSKECDEMMSRVSQFM